MNEDSLGERGGSSRSPRKDDYLHYYMTQMDEFGSTSSLDEVNMGKPLRLFPFSLLSFPSSPIPMEERYCMPTPPREHLDYLLTIISLYPTILFKALLMLFIQHQSRPFHAIIPFSNMEPRQVEGDQGINRKKEATKRRKRIQSQGSGSFGGTRTSTTTTSTTTSISTTTTTTATSVP